MVTPNKKKLKKAFTITELVIVIAVIAILAAVLIPTLSGVISKANQSVALQESKSSWTNYSADVLTDSNYTKDTYYVVHYDDGKADYYFTVTEGQFNTSANEYTDDTDDSEWKAGWVYTEYQTNGTTVIAKIYSKYVNDDASGAVTAVETAIGTGVDGTTYYAYALDTVNNYEYYLVLEFDGSAWAVTNSTANDYADADKAAVATISKKTEGDYTVTVYVDSATATAAAAAAETAIASTNLSADGTYYAKVTETAEGGSTYYFKCVYTHTGTSWETTQLTADEYGDITLTSTATIDESNTQASELKTAGYMVVANTEDTSGTNP